MNISSKVFLIDGSFVLDYFFYNGTDVEISFAKTAVDVMIFLLGFPIDSYVIWLIATGTGNVLAAEFFSLNHSICEMLFYMDCLLSSFRSKDDYVWKAASFFNGLALTGRPLFQSLICVERYMAVVHPVSFLKYKPFRYRLICSIIVWVTTLTSGGVNVISFSMPHLMTLYYIFIMAHFILCFSIQLYFLVAVLRALKQSGPGDRRRQPENHMKRKAFYIILITTLSMLIVMIFHLILVSFAEHDLMSFLCFVYVGFALAGLVQPLLFLYRVDKMAFIKCQ